MKNNITYRSFCLTFVALAALSLPSCIKEDMSKCLQPVMELSIMFTDPYGAKDFEKGVNTDEFSHVSLFVYDQNNRLFATTDLYECRLETEYDTKLDLPAGNYNLVAWIGTEALYYILDDTDIMDKASMSLYIPEDHLIDYWLSHLYFGKSPVTVNKARQVVNMPVIQDTNDINFTVHGLDSQREYTFVILDDNGKYNFENDYLPCDYFGTLSGSLFLGEENFESRITILRLKNDHESMLYLFDNLTQELIYPSYQGQEANLVTLIKKAYNNSSFDFDSRHIFDISLEFDADMKATVFINGWEVKEDDYEI